MFNDASCEAIAQTGGIPPLVALIASGTTKQKDKAANALQSLSKVADIKKTTLRHAAQVWLTTVDSLKAEDAKRRLKANGEKQTGDKVALQARLRAVLENATFLAS